MRRWSSMNQKAGTHQIPNLLMPCSWTPQALVKVKVLVAQSCLTLRHPMDLSSSGSSVHGILQALLQCVAIPVSRGPSPPRDRTWVSHIAGTFFII